MKAIQNRDREGAAREGAAREGAARDGAAREGAAREGAARDGAARDGAAREGVARDGAARDGADHHASPAAYLVTWVCYGAWLPGQAGAISRTQNRFGTPVPEPDIRKELRARARMTQQPYLLDEIRRQLVLQSLIEVCSCRGYILLAAHVRTNHIHVVTAADCKPEHVLNAMKAYSSRALNQHALDRPGTRRWARHGSTRYLWTQDAVRSAIAYVAREQGDPMAVFETSSPR